MPVPRETIRDKRFDDWNADASPILDAIDAAHQILNESGYNDVTVRVSFRWPDASAYEESTGDARQALLGAARLQYANVWISASVRRDLGETRAQPARLVIEALNLSWLRVEAQGENVELVQQVFDAAVAEVDQAIPADTRAENDAPRGALEPAPTAVATPSDHPLPEVVRTSRGGVSGWIEDHHAVIGVVIGIATVILAIATLLAN